MKFTASTVSGLGLGKDLGSPTINIDLSSVPDTMEEGIYACFVSIGNQKLGGALHYGPRPVFDNSTACEVHVLDEIILKRPDSITIELVKKIRDVQDFKSQEALIEQIQTDIKKCNSILHTSHF